MNTKFSSKACCYSDNETSYVARMEWKAIEDKVRSEGTPKTKYKCISGHHLPPIPVPFLLRRLWFGIALLRRGFDPVVVSVSPRTPAWSFNLSWSLPLHNSVVKHFLSAIGIGSFFTFVALIVNRLLDSVGDSVDSLASNFYPGQRPTSERRTLLESRVGETNQGEHAAAATEPSKKVIAAKWWIGRARTKGGVER